jgi:chromosome segregation protein
MLLNLERQRVERDRLKQESERLSIRIGELQNALKAASRSFIETKDQLESAQQRRPVDASLAQLTEHGKRVGLQDGRCPLCGSPLVEHDFTGHIQIIENELAKRSADIQSLVSEHAQASTLEAEARRKYEATSLELSRCTAALQTITSGFESAQDTAARLGVDMNVEAINTSLQADRSDLSELERGFELLQAILASGRIADLEQSKLELDERSNGLAIRSNRLGAAAQNAKSAADSIKRVAWEIVDERLAALSPLLSEMYVRLRPHAAYGMIPDYAKAGEADPSVFPTSARNDEIATAGFMSSPLHRIRCDGGIMLIHEESLNPAAITGT